MKHHYPKIFRVYNKIILLIGMLFIVSNFLYAQSNDPLFIDPAGNVYIKVKNGNKLSVEGNAIFSDTLSVGVLKTGKLSGLTNIDSLISNTANIVKQLTVSGNAEFNGNVGIGISKPESKLEIAGQVKITGGSPGEGKTLTSDVNGLATWEKGARRDWRPYGKPSFFWDGGIGRCDSIEANYLGKKGNAGINTDYYQKPWMNKKAIIFTNLSQEALNTATPPESGFYITLPATANIHNSLLISTRDADRWSVWSVWLCDSQGNSCIKLALSANNSNPPTALSTTYTLSPRNTLKETSLHAWLTFPVNVEEVKKYIADGNLKFLITSGPNNDENNLMLSGLALVPNPSGFMQQPARTLHLGLNGGQFDVIKWWGVWNNEGLGYIPGNSTLSVSAYIKVVDPSKDLLVTFLEHNSGWYGGTLNITVGDDKNIFNPSTGIIGMSSILYSSSSFMRPESIIVPAEIIKAQLINSPGGVTNILRLNLQNPGDNHYHFRGIDTEIY